MRRRTIPHLILCGILFELLPTCAHAHPVTSDVGEFFGGVLHPLTFPPHLLLLIGLGILAAQRGLQNLRVPLITFAAVAVASLLLTLTGRTPAIPQALIVGLSLFTGLMVAFALKLPGIGVAIWYGIAAGLLGLDSTMTGRGEIELFKLLSGVWVGLVLVVGDVAYFASFCKTRQWTQIGLRVVGSWIAAISLMLLAFLVKR